MNLDTLTSLFARLSTYHPMQVALELLLIGLSVNWCAGVLHGTRGTRLLRGVLVLLVAVTLIVRVVAVQLGWQRLELLYGYFVTGLGMVALVAFQPELRRALIRAGEVSFFRRAPRGDARVAALVEAAGYLSRNRYGALIAIQRDVGLGNWVENGTQLNADLTANLLSSIFFPNSALHDLGVVIREERVLAAGCQFPIAEGGDIDPTLGSRHRAAIGLSAESDALVLVVSEETGAISIADRGRLHRFLTLDDLDLELRSRLGGQAQRRSSTGLRMSDLWRVARRLLVVGPLTLVIWVLADQASLSLEEGVAISLKLSGDLRNKVDVLAPEPPTFVASVRGPTRQVQALRRDSSDRPAVLEWKLPYTAPGRVELSGSKLLAVLNDIERLRAAGLSIQRVEPARLEYAVDDIETVTLPIRLESGPLRFDDARIEPAEAQVTMRKGDLAAVPPADRFLTAQIQERLNGGATGVTPQTLRSVLLSRKIGEFEWLDARPSVVQVTLTPASRVARRRLPERIPVQTLASPQFFRSFEVEQRDPGEWLIELEIEGEHARIESLRPQDILAYVAFASDATPTSEFRALEVRIVTPPDVHVVGPPPVVRARLLLREAPVP